MAYVPDQSGSFPLARGARLALEPERHVQPYCFNGSLRLIADVLSEMQERLRANARERTAMIGGIAHDLRTPPACIAFGVEARGEPLRASVPRNIDQIHAMVGATVAYIRGDTDTLAQLQPALLMPGG